MRKKLIMLRECVVMSAANIWRSKMRSFLTILGILIGVAAVIALITTVNGFSGTLSSSFSSMGAGTLTVSISGSDLKSGLSPEDLEELTSLDAVDGITPSVSLRARVSRGTSYKSSVTISGKNYFWFTRNTAAVERGRYLNPVDEENMSFVCVISHDIMEALFFGTDPVGETMYIDGIPFLVTGILSDDSSSLSDVMSSGSGDIYIPYTTALKMNSSSEVTSMTVYLADGVSSEDGESVLEETLDGMFSYEDDCFTITTMSSVEDTMDSMLQMVSALLAGIASIALVVGGIGIMNMMLTTVTERTAEIGLKKALGALPGQIQLQFLIESFMLSMAGGVLGIACGLILSLILSGALGTEFALSTGAITLGSGFSAAVGIVFGWAPARKASRLNPIDALRSA